MTIERILTQPEKQLLQEAKDKLRITWDEEDEHVWRLVEAAQVEIDGRFGTKCDYLEPGMPKTLMLEHIFYNRNNVLHEFRNAYFNELMDVAISVIVENGMAQAKGENANASNG